MYIICGYTDTCTFLHNLYVHKKPHIHSYAHTHKHSLSRTSSRWGWLILRPLSFLGQVPPWTCACLGPCSPPVLPVSGPRQVGGGLGDTAFYTEVWLRMGMWEPQACIAPLSWILVRDGSKVLYRRDSPRGAWLLLKV